METTGMTHKQVQPDVDVMVHETQMIKDHTGVQFTRDIQFTARIIGFVEGSQTKVIVTRTQRGAGWDEMSQTYKPIKRVVNAPQGASVSYHTHSIDRDGYGEQTVHHKKDLTVM